MMRILIPAFSVLVFAAACGTDTDAGRTPVPSVTAPGEGGEIATALPTLVSAQPPAATPVPAVVDRVTTDLAARLRAPVGGITVVSLEPFTWPDGCLGLGGPGVVCTQALAPGWLAVLRGPDGREYRYRGSGERFAIEP
jgi:hypothetical protein